MWHESYIGEYKMCKKMRKKLFVCLLLCTFLFGCSKENVTSNEGIENIPENINAGNSSTEIMGRLEHGLRNYLIDDNTGEAYITYNGGELCFEYSVCASGMAEKGVGFMIFINGEPQLYRTDKEEYKYMHKFYLEDNVENTISFYLVPTTGQKGETLELCIASVYYPDYKPDLISSKGFGIFHHMLESIYLLKYNEAPSMDFDKSANVNKTALLRIESIANIDGTVKEAESNFALRTYMDDQDTTAGNYYIVDKKSIHIRMEISGAQSAEYGCTFYINHTPVFCDQESTVHIQTASNQLTVIEADIDASLLEGHNVFYAILAPCNARQISTANIGLEKTNSVLLVSKEIDTESDTKQMSLNDFSGYICYAGSDQLICLGEKVTLLSSQNFDVLNEIQSEDLGISFYDFQDCEVYANENGYIVIGTVYDAKNSDTRLVMVEFSQELDNVNIINVEEWVGAEREIMAYELIDDGRKILYSTMNGFYLYDSACGETTVLNTGDVFVLDFAFIESSNQILFMGNNLNSERVLGRLTLGEKASKAEIYESNLWGKIWSYSTGALIEEADVYGEEKTGQVFCYSTQDGIQQYPLTGKGESGSILLSCEGEYYATNTYVQNEGYILRIYSSEDGQLVCEYFMTYEEYGEKFRLNNILIYESTNKIILAAKGLENQEGTWLMVMDL